MRRSIKYDPLEDPIARLKDFRSSFTLNNIIPQLSQCQITKERFEHDGHSVDIYWINYPARNFQGNSDKLLLYFHGGGYISGDIQSTFECYLSQLFDLTILHVEYRLSPEHPLSAAIDDTVAIYRALLHQTISPSQILIIGDSAGGGLALLTIQAVLARQLRVSRGIIALSP
ncbi:unnamed protein product [Rotaria sp. Silwood2]|nr:unnamed protein product [Rotaria sp. Silwood2]CAF4429193.1 unnamed protein product [Rotaria sp. Silwood2]